MTAGRRLRVGVAQDLFHLPPRSGHGRVWRHVLAELGKLVDLRDGHGKGGVRGLLRGRPQAWVADATEGAVDVRGPVVAQLYEACWFDDRLKHLFSPGFLEQIDARARAGIATSTEIVAPSESARREIESGYGVAHARIHVVPLGVDTEVFRPGLTGGPEIVMKASGAAPRPYILFAGSVHPRKNLPAVRDAVAMLAAHGLPHGLVIVASRAPDRPDSSELEAAAVAELPGAPGRVVRVLQPGDTELAALMAGADAFCLPSFSEGFGLTALEAMACGAPVVVSDRGALPEVVGDGGVAVAPAAEPIAVALERILTHSEVATGLRRAARARAETFTWERTARGWAALLQAAASG